jgi:hypothetical protein
VKVFVEAGAKKVFAGAIDWPGWARCAKTEEAALRALVDYGPRYAHSMGGTMGMQRWPTDVNALEVVERLKGGSGTDFGVPSAVAGFDRQPLAEPELARLIDLLQASWAAVAEAAQFAEGRPLATGPRGGGRTLDKILTHVAEADRAYISQVGAKTPPGNATWAELQDAFVDALHAKVRGELPEVGPRGGERWPARYAIRRSAWHALDHVWEIEDRQT